MSKDKLVYVGKMEKRMKEGQPIRDLLDNPETDNFIYRPPSDYKQHSLPGTLRVKFAQRRVILDDWWLIGGTPWSRFKFRIKHPIVYSKRGLKNLWRRIKRIFVKPKMIQPLSRHPHDKRLMR